MDVVRIVTRSVVGSVQRRRPWLAMPRHAYLESFLDFFEHVQGDIRITYHDNTPDGLLRGLKKIKADVVLPVNGTLGRDFPVPWVGYLYDFQHKYFPQNFTPGECSDRDIDFTLTLMDAKAVVVNSRAVKDDVSKFHPDVDASIFNLPFSPNPMKNWLDPLPEDMIHKYELPSRYFLISNQFWVHKDHLTALKALADLNDFLDVSIVCTGTMEDYRKPEHIDELRAFIAGTGLSERVKLLGHIPKRDQIELMKEAIAVVQPTLFEGGPGGGCVYDAVSLGVPVILSDIPINQEVVVDNRWFFKAGDSGDLAAVMREVLNAKSLRPANEILLKRGQLNLEKLGDRLLEAVSCVA